MKYLIQPNKEKDFECKPRYRLVILTVKVSQGYFLTKSLCWGMTNPCSKNLLEKLVYKIGVLADSNSAHWRELKRQQVMLGFASRHEH